ncbi:hypothetical protein IQ251_15515 [Saccharopolyspora sp. HNM0983]|uniref:Secreted protein n=1 Tax=Saccharopolyspora montiporae TaxID=2781240 RepID=A0A929BE02_9PSEU|nr:hypothetical protein [Saccharopolyspora sp. HNM0983]MBE9375858.1 hypothetical protein [Saccharopolyspora sp. HNM0983]
MVSAAAFASLTMLALPGTASADTESVEGVLEQTNSIVGTTGATVAEAADKANGVAGTLRSTLSDSLGQANDLVGTVGEVLPGT